MAALHRAAWHPAGVTWADATATPHGMGMPHSLAMVLALAGVLSLLASVVRLATRTG